jgi:16S rRNA (adenine1518-N6/adenine1519-N6)-dimethyltransferase
MQNTLPECIATRAGTRAVIERYGLSVRKKLGQHFLVDPFVLEKILAAANLGENDVVLEIGPGIGGLPQGMAKRAGHVVAVELDKRFVAILEELFAGKPVTVVHGDILKMNPEELLAPYKGLTKKVVANLPYYITTPVILSLLESGLGVESLTVMIQKEVARRMAAAPGTKDYGSLTLAVGYYADVELVANVPVNCFMPRPAVDSAVVHMVPLPKPRVDTDKALLFKTIHAAFNQRRKTLVNALSAVLDLPKEKTADAVKRCGLPPDIRGETLDMAAFAALTEVLF